MKSGLLLALRITTGALLIVWGSLRAFSPERGVGLADRYYGGAVNTETIQAAFGWSEIVLGALVILGLFRILTYPLQALILVGGSLAIWKHILDPLSLYLFTGDDRANLLFFPSSTVAVAALILIFFKEYDTLALDRVFRR
ncbi:MAG: hypothetical protein AAGD92_00905 [Pseudomonadota bacterium]